MRVVWLRDISAIRKLSSQSESPSKSRNSDCLRCNAGETESIKEIREVLMMTLAKLPGVLDDHEPWQKFYSLLKAGRVRLIFYRIKLPSFIFI